MNKNRVRALARATSLAVVVGSTQLVSAQPEGRSGRDMMGDTNQYGAMDILGVLIGVAVLVLLVFLVMRVSRKSGTP